MDGGNGLVSLEDLCIKENEDQEGEVACKAAAK